MSELNKQTLLLLSTLYSFFFFFHFLTKICARFSSLGTSAIELKFYTMCRMVNHNSWAVTFCGNLTYFTGGSEKYLMTQNSRNVCRR